MPTPKNERNEKSRAKSDNNKHLGKRKKRKRNDQKRICSNHQLHRFSFKPDHKKKGKNETDISCG